MAAIFLLVGVFFPGESSAQQEEGQLWASAKTIGEDSVVIQWLPVSPTKWKASWEGGFRIERYPVPDAVLDNAGFDPPWEEMAAGRAVTLPEVLLQDSTTIAADTAWGDGYPAVVAFMLYDSAFNDGIDVEGVTLQQYDMLKLGAVFHPEKIGTSLGLAIVETGLDTSVNHLYRIRAVDDPTLVQEVYLARGGGGIPRYRAVLDLGFENHPFSELLPPEPQAFPLAGRGRGMGDSVVVRWIVTDATLLRASLYQGYLLHKQIRRPDPARKFGFLYETVEDSIVVKPWSKEKLADYLANNPAPDSSVLVAAQLLYGDTQPDGELSKQEALDNMLAFGLQAADQSALAAEVLGLRYVDREVARDGWYVYTVTMPTDSVTTWNETGQYVVQVDNTYDGPSGIIDFAALEGEFVVNLVLSRENEDNYSQYFFERAPLGTDDWQPLHEGPIVFEVSRELDDRVSTFMFSDSLERLYEPYRYRTRGQNAFQEYSPWAELTARARDRTPPPVAHILPLEMPDDETVRVSWETAVTRTAPDLAGFYLKMGHLSSVEDQPIVTELIPADRSSFDFRRPGVPFTNDSSYFFQVAAVDTAGNISSSFPLGLRVVDSIPPLPPTGLSGNIDTNGVMTLVWLPSPERDAAGYQVYFANDTAATFSQVTVEDLVYNVFRDTLPLNTLNEAIYYRVSAFDRSYNNSEWSEIVRVERPDVVPPTAAVLLLPKPSGAGVELNWTPSSSSDKVAYAVLRRDPADESGRFAVVDSLPATLATYVDTTADYEVAYDYALVTVDDAGLSSTPSNTQTGRRIFTADVGGVGELTVALEGEGEGARPQVRWTYEKPEEDLLAEADHRFMLYRAKSDGQLTRYKQLRSKEPRYLDQAVEPGTTYRYAVMVVYSNGKKSGLSDAGSVTVPEEGR